MKLEMRAVSQTAGARPVLRALSVAFEGSRFYGIIGPNGVGKSTLLHLLSGIDKPDSGEVLLDGRPLDRISRRELARQLALLQQGGLPQAGFTVREVVAMGRYPYQNWLGGGDAEAQSIIDEALQTANLTSLAERKLSRLSGGERQRTALAKLLVQQTGILLLDEPTTYLDIGYQLELLDTIRAWQRERGLLVIAVLHDLNAAALYCDELVALHEGRIVAAGSPEAVITEPFIARIYGTDAAVVKHPDTGAPQMMLRPGAGLSANAARKNG